MPIGGRAPERLLDPRSAGLYPIAFFETSPDDWLQDLQQKGYEWTEKKRVGVIEVSGSPEKQAAKGEPFRVIVWRIDPEKDDAILDIRVFAGHSDGRRELLEHMKADYRQFDGRWWPTRCMTKSEAGAGYEEFIFTRVEFDREEHPSKLGPDVLGIPPGINAIDRIHHTPGSGPLKMGRYIGGGQIVSVDDWHEHYKNLHDSTAFTEFVARAQAIGRGAYPMWWSAGEDTLGVENVSRTPDLWEVYVRRWITRHNYGIAGAQGAATAQSLTPAQVDAAWAILKDCRRRASPILHKRKKNTASASLDATQDKEPRVPTTTIPKGKSIPANAPALDRYEKELEKIFYSLKGRLDGLLTTKQQDADVMSDSERKVNP